MPALLTILPGIAFISDVSSRSRVPPTISGMGEHRVADDRQAAAERGRESLGGTADGSASIA